VDTLTVFGKRLEVRRIAPKASDTPTLVFLHEGLGCVGMWRDYPDKLAEATGCGALIYSRLGYGGSDPCALPRPLDYMTTEGLEVLPELLRVAGVTDCILIGHSDGGSIALIYAGGTVALPLRAVITEAAHVFCEQISVSSIAKARDDYLDADLKAKLASYHFDNTDCAFRGWNSAWLHPDFMQWNIEGYLPAISVPLLAIQGENDEYGTPAQVKAITDKSGGRVKVAMLDRCAHTPHRDRPDTVLEEMARFILSVCQQASILAL
jgi:pimeloyl-ACP methyl ester carboxylesterase